MKVDEYEKAAKAIKQARKNGHMRHAFWCAFMEAFCEYIQLGDDVTENDCVLIANKWSEALTEEFKEKVNV